MPELCGSTTVSASIVAIAASVALPPWRSIAAPASAARGSAALTTPREPRPGGGARLRRKRWRRPPSSSGAASASRMRCSMARCAIRFRPPRQWSRSRRAASAPRARARSRRAMPGPFVDHRAVELDQARPGADALPGVLGGGDPADPDQRQRAAGRLAEVAQPLRARVALAARPTARPPRPRGASAAAGARSWCWRRSARRAACRARCARSRRCRPARDRARP